MITKHLLDKLIPLACDWVEEQEKTIGNFGEELSDDQKIDAYLIGVKQIERVRLMRVQQIPTPALEELKSAVDYVGLLTKTTIGVTFRYGIYIQESHWQQRSLIVHELTHTMQYERLGGIEPFLRKYIDEYITDGYPNGSLEQEATAMEKKICS